MTKYIIAVAALLAIALAVSMKTCTNRTDDRNRLAGNQTALMNRAKFYQTNDSLSTASVQRLQL